MQEGGLRKECIFLTFVKSHPPLKQIESWQVFTYFDYIKQ